MSVHQTRQGKGSWRYDFMVHGRRYTGAGFKTMRAARSAEELHRREVSLGLSADISTFGELVDVFLSASLRTKSEPWVYQMRLKLNKVFSHLARVQLAKLRRVHFEQALSMMHDAGSSPGSVNEYRKIVNAVMAFGVRNEVILRNPVSGIPTMPTDLIEARTISTENLGKLIRDTTDDDTRNLVVFLSQTGARSVEAFRLLWSDVHTGEQPWCPLVTRKTRGGSEERRKQPLTALSLAAIEAQRGKSDRYVFPGPTGGVMHYRTAHKRLAVACDEAKVPRIGFHAIRHWCGYIATSEGGNIKAASKVLGHKTASATERYLHATDAERLEIVGRLEQQLIDVGASVGKEFTHRV